MIPPSLRRPIASLLFLSLAPLVGPTAEAQSEATGSQSSLVSRFAADLDPENPLPEYPRPQFVRDRWQNLNGEWEYAIRPGGSLGDAAGPDPASIPQEWDGRIVVPFCPESILSQVNRRVGEGNVLWYRRTFEVPADWHEGDVLLHFGAVDWETSVVVNGVAVGAAPHRGGYDMFSHRIGSLLKRGATNDIVVRVWDPTDAGAQPRGKQVNRPEGIWYTPVTGIWQTVWLEPVPKTSIASLRTTPDVANGRVKFDVSVEAGGSPARGAAVTAVIRLDGREVSHAAGSSTGSTVTLDIPLPDARLWTPDTPILYDVEFSLGGDDGDTVQSYFGMRSIALGPADDGHLRLFLNGQPLFQYGPLDQGWWPDGLYTAPTDAALRYDIEVTKQLGFNMARKHVKVEPARWYYWCDKLGLLVWQDLPSAMAQGKDQFVHPGEPDRHFSAAEHAQWMAELKAMMDTHYNAPCIVVWCPFNEGWGQHQTNEVLQWTTEYDPTRLTNGPSGWEDRGFGHMKDMHRYPGPGMFPAMADRASVLGEFGGLGLPLEGHTWVDSNNWGYRTFESIDELRVNYDRLIDQLPGLISSGLAAAVYTQTTDVEVEVNGLMTYDRQVIKFDPEHLRTIHAPLYGPPPRREVLLPTSELAAQEWQYTTTRPDGNRWTTAEFDPQGWSTGPGGLGTEGTPNTRVRTVWNTSDIWVRREFTVDAADRDSERLFLRLYHDEDATVYLNGREVAQLPGYVPDYIEVPLTDVKLAAGTNVLAIHCHQTGGGQYIDAGLVRLLPRDSAASR